MIEPVIDAHVEPRPVAVTGMGVVSPVGIGTAAYWDGLVAGVDAIRPLDRFAVDGLYTSLAAQVPGEYFGDAFAEACRNGTLAWLYVEEAVRQALTQAGVGLDLSHAGFVVGTTVAQLGIFERFLASRHSGKAIGAAACRDVPYSRLADRLAAEHGSAGFTFTVNTACTSAHQALSVGAGAIRRGITEVAVVAGVDALCPTVYTGFACLKALAAQKVRPFDARRDGLALGEGSGAIVLESLEHARRRGAAVSGFIRAYGIAGDANHISGPDRDGAGLARAVCSCLKNARCDPVDLDLVSAHGTGTVYNDRMESIALKTALGGTAFRIPVIALKSRFGHTLGAAGALEIIAGVLAMQQGLVLRTLNHERGDDTCDLDYAAEGNRRRDIARMLVTAAGFGGQNAAVVLERSHD